MLFVDRIMGGFAYIMLIMFYKLSKHFLDRSLFFSSVLILSTPVSIVCTSLLTA